MPTSKQPKIISLDTKTRWGRVVGILWIGERYYIILSPSGVVSLMPAVVVEAKP